MKKTIAFLRNIGRKALNKTNVTLATGAALATSAFATGEPVDLSSAGTATAAYVPTAAGWALPIFIAVVGVGVIIKVFSKVGKKG